MIKYLEKDFETEIKDKKVLIDFYANWCGPCKMFSEVLENIEKKINIDILKVDVDKFPEIASSYNIYSIPTICILENNNLKKSHTGYLNPNELLEFINKE